MKGISIFLLPSYSFKIKSPGTFQVIFLIFRSIFQSEAITRQNEETCYFQRSIDWHIFKCHFSNTMKDLKYMLLESGKIKVMSTHHYMECKQSSQTIDGIHISMRILSYYFIHFKISTLRFLLKIILLLSTDIKQNWIYFITFEL